MNNKNNNSATRSIGHNKYDNKEHHKHFYNNANDSKSDDNN